MGEIVHVRATQVEVKGSGESQTHEKLHRNEAIHVISRLSRTLGLMPNIDLQWEITNRYQGYPLLVFHNRSGFGDENSGDLRQHGNLIVDTVENHSHSMHLEEGKHYFTFILRSRGLFSSLVQLRSPALRFSIEVPSVENMIKAMQNKVTVQKEAQNLDLLSDELEIRANESKLRLLESRRKLEAFQNPKAKSDHSGGRKSFLDKELQDVDALIEAVIAGDTKIAQIQADPRFLKLTKTRQDEIFKIIEARLDPSELSAKREMGES